MDVKNLGSSRICVVTDSNVAKLHAMHQVIAALEAEDLRYTVFDRTVVEPKESS